MLNKDSNITVHIPVMDLGKKFLEDGTEIDVPNLHKLVGANVIPQMLPSYGINTLVVYKRGTIVNLQILL